MGNALKGEVTLSGGGEEYTLLLDINALCVLEDKLDQSTAQIIERMQGLEKNMRLGFLRTVVWAALQEKHPGLNEKQVGGIITDVGLPETLGKVVESFRRSFPAAEADDGAGPPPPPEEAPADGTGPTSTEAGTTSA